MRPAILLAALLLLPVGAPPAGAADEPLYLGWTSALPPTVGSYDPSSADDCRAGQPGCVQHVIVEMTHEFDPLAAACDHDALFALAYLRTTQAYQVAAAEPDFFADPRFVNHEAAVFAEFYFRAYDDWAAGRRDTVPQAWRIAFAAADGRRVSGSGNLLLGISAHINRDLPFALATIGLVRPDGASRKPDHDRVNGFLNRVVAPLIAEAAARFDPTIDDADTPYGLSYTATMQLLLGWREEAWRNAERLAAAPGAASRAVVAAEIEAAATAKADAIATATAYTPPVSDSRPRDAYCASRASSQ